MLTKNINPQSCHTGLRSCPIDSHRPNNPDNGSPFGYHAVTSIDVPVLQLFHIDRAMAAKQRYAIQPLPFALSTLHQVQLFRNSVSSHPPPALTASPKIRFVTKHYVYRYFGASCRPNSDILRRGSVAPRVHYERPLTVIFAGSHMPR